MKPSRPLHLLAVAVGTGVVCYAVWGVIYGDLPALPWSSFAGLFLLAIAEASLAGSVRARLAGRPRTKPILPMQVARFAVLAKASALVGAIAGGAWTGIVAFVALHRSEYPKFAGRDLVTGILSIVASAVLLVVALRLENACRVPPPPPAAEGG